MKINFGTILKDLDNKPIKNSQESPLTLGQVSSNALLAILPEDRVKGDEKADRFILALEVNTDKEVELKPEQVAKIKERIGDVYAPLIVGRAYEVLDK